MMFQRVNAGMLVVSAIGVYGRNFLRLIVFPLIVGTLGALGQMLLFRPMQGALYNFAQSFGLDNNVYGLSDVHIAAQNLRVLAQEITPYLWFWLAYLATVGLLASALVTGGVTRIALEALQHPDAEHNETPPQLIFSELKRTPKWYVTAILQGAVLLVLVLLMSLVISVLGMWATNLAVFGTIVMVFVLTTANAATAMLFPIIAENGFRGALRRALVLFMRRPGLVVSMGIWLLMLQTASLAIGGFIGAVAGMPAMHLFVTALFAPISIVAVCLMYNELRQGISDGGVEDLRGL